MDIIICTTLKDCLISKKTIRYIRKNIDVDAIYILTDKNNFKFYSDRFKTKYGVIPLDETLIVPNRQRLKEVADAHFTCDFRFGWYYQQFLKMNFARSEYAKKHYLIWDSDTIPLHKLNLLEGDQMVFTPKTEHHKSYFEAIERMFGYGKMVPYSFIAEHMIVDTAIMKEIVTQIESLDIAGDSWTEKAIHATTPDNPNAFSEFETYGTYCYVNYPNRYKTRELRTYRGAGEKYSRLISDWYLARLAKKYDTISLEDWSETRRMIPRMKNRIAAKYTAFLDWLL